MEGPSKRDPAVTTGRTSQNKLVHFAPDDGRTVPVGLVRRRPGHRRRPPPPGRRAGGGHRPAPPPHRASRWPPVDARSTGRAPRWWRWSGRRRRASPPWPWRWPRPAGIRPPAPSGWSCARSTRWRSTGAWTSARPSPPPEAGPRCPYHLVDLVDPGAEFTVQQFQAAAREALAGVAARGRAALLVGGTGLYLRSVVDDLEFPGRFPEVAGASGRAWRRPAPGRPGGGRRPRGAPCPPGRPRPGGGRPDRTGQPPPPGPGPGGDRGLGPAVLVVRAGARGVPPEPGGAGGDPAGPRRDRPPDRRAVRRHDGGRPARRGAAPGGRPGGLSPTARQALGYRELLAHLEDGLPLEEAVAETVRRTRAFARRQWAWFRRDPRIVWLADGEDPVARIAGLLAGPVRD